MPFSAEAADRAVRFFERILVHTKAEWAGLPFTLMDWQRDEIIRPLFGTLKADGTRQYRTAYVEVPRKNGKSEIAAGIALYLLFADGEPGAEVYGAAKDKDQASIVFNVAGEMVKHSAVLTKRARVIDSTKRIVLDGSPSFYRAIPADAAGSHGFNASGIVFDELHVQPNRELWDVLATSTGARRQPLTFAITTAGFDRNSICYEQHDYALKVLNGVIEDPSFFAYIRGAQEGDDWQDEAIWHKANPGLGVTVKLDYLRGEAKKAMEVPAYENTFRRLHLDQWTQQETRWLPIDKWDASAGSVDPDSLKGRDCYGGLDMASTTDIAALALVFPVGGLFLALMHFWIPEENMIERVRRDRVPYDLWVRQGYITATPGNVIDYATIQRDIKALSEVYHIVDLGFDRWGAVQLTQGLQGEGITVVPIGQGFASMSAPTKELLNLVMGQRLHHGRNPVLRWMADNMVVSTDAAANLKPNKEKSAEKIDGMVALIMAIDRATRQEDTTSKYEESGLLVL